MRAIKVEKNAMLIKKLYILKEKSKVSKSIFFPCGKISEIFE